MSALPKAIQTQLDKAEALQAQMNGTPAPDTGNTEAAEAPMTPPLQLVEPEVPAQVTSTTPDIDWEQRFRVMQGKYDAELPRLHQQNRELSDRLDQAIKTMEAKADTAAKKDVKLVTDADIEAYGEDLVDMVRRAAREEFDTLSARFSEAMDQRYGVMAEKVDRTEQRQVTSDTDKFWSAVTAPDAVPDFDEVNNDSRWFAFLDSRAPGARYTRRILAEDAMKYLDATALIEQVKAFKDSIGIAPTASTPAKPKPSRDSQVTPSSSRASAPAVQTGKIWTGQEYASALDHRSLKHISREEYAQNIAEAELALAEGRVQF